MIFVASLFESAVAHPGQPHVVHRFNLPWRSGRRDSVRQNIAAGLGLFFYIGMVLLGWVGQGYAP